jgi:hypothetical protein
MFGYSRMSSSEAPVYAEDNYTLQGTLYSFEFSGVLTGSSVADFATQLEDMRCALAQPRQTLLIQWSEDNSTWVTEWNFPPGQPGSANFGDMSWGPFPGDLRITKMMGGRSAIYGWSIKCFRKDCFGNDCTLENANNAILSLTRRWQHTVDGSGLTTRTVSGKLVITAESVMNQQPADNYRFVVLPPLPVNFKREKQDFNQSEDGRELTFSIVDQETKFTLPVPISEGNVNWTVRVEEYGALVRYILSGRLSAPPAVTKNAIFQQVLAIAAAKFPLGTQTLVFEQRELSEDVYGNTVNFMISAFQSAGVQQGTPNSSLPNFTTGLDTFGIVPPTNSGQAYIITPYGGDSNANSGVIADVPIIYDACNGSIASSSQANSGARNGGYPSGGFSGTPPWGAGDMGQTENNSGISAYHDQAPYIAVHERISFECDNGIVVFPAKVKGQKPIAQQIHNPIITIIQAGYISRYAQDITLVPAPNPPFINPDGINAVLQQWNIEAQTPQPIGDGLTNLYTISWRYIIKLIGGQEQAGTTNNGLNMAFPWDPRRTTDPTQTTPMVFPSTIPELIANPQ